MELYHGTSIEKLDEILRNGITPREERQSNWKKAPSRSDMVYLSTVYPFYFSVCAANSNKTVVFEIDLLDLDRDKLYPDEDFIWQWQKRENKGKIIEHKDIRKNLEWWKFYWKESLKFMGTCCYKGIIKPEFIQRYCIFDCSKRTWLAMSIMDPSISIDNFRFLSAHYEGFVSWLFGDQKLLPHVAEAKRDSKLFADNEQIYTDYQKRILFWTKESQNRDGIEIVELKNEKVSKTKIK